MKERPILFSGEMIRALIAGRKTQTRRVVKPQPIDGDTICKRGIDPGWIVGRLRDSENAWRDLRCPYGIPGDHLWVRENGWERPERTPKMMRDGADTWEPYYFDADGLSATDCAEFKEWRFKRRPSIHMPRKASRITLEITGVRVEPLQEISQSDVFAEGLRNHDMAIEHSAQQAYAALWDQINGAGAWDKNPWVWVVGFKLVP